MGYTDLCQQLSKHIGANKVLNSIQQEAYDYAVLNYVHGQEMPLEQAEQMARDLIESDPFILPPADPRKSDINEMPWE